MAWNMIVRNSIHSVTRSPMKSFLFFILILVLTMALTLGTALSVLCGMMLAQCDRLYVTSAVLEYTGGRYPERAVVDPDAARYRSEIDFGALGSLDYVRDVNREETVVLAFPGLNRTTTEGLECENAVVLSVRVLEKKENFFTVSVVRDLYSAAFGEGKVLSLYVSDPEYETVETGHTYLITGYSNGGAYGVVPVNVMPVSNRLSEGKYGTLCMSDVTGMSDAECEASPELRYFFDAAESYRVINTSWYARIAPDPSYLEPFSQRDYAISKGHLYTKEEAAEKICCVLPEHIGLRMGYTIGDTAEIRIASYSCDDIADSYWKGLSDAEGTVRACVTGFTTSTGNEMPLIYLSSTGTEGPAGFVGYSLGTLLLKNGLTQEQEKEIRGMLPAGVSVSFYDQGYAQITEAIRNLLENAVVVSVAGAVISVAMLVLFAYLFIGKQRDSLETMYMMGTPRKGVRVYVLLGSGILLTLASLIGAAAALFMSDLMNALITGAMRNATSVLNLYSSGSLGVVQVLSSTEPIPFHVGLSVFLFMTLTGILFCLGNMRIILGGIGKQKPERKRKKAKRPRKANMLSISGASRKYVILSFLRGGARTWLSVLVCALMALFVLIPSYAVRQYEKEEEQLAKNTKISGFFTNYSGKTRYGLVLPSQMTDTLAECEYLTNFHFNQSGHYAVLSTGSGYEGGDMGLGKGENLLGNLERRPRIVYTLGMDYVSEFQGKTDASVRWAPGFDDSFFELPFLVNDHIAGYRGGDLWYFYGEDPRLMGIVVSETFLERYGTHLGDTVEILSSDGENLATETYTIVGTVSGLSNEEYIYTRLENALKFLWLPSYGAGPGEQTLVRFRNTYDSGYFELRDTNEIKEAKAWLEEKGFSRVHTAGFYRLYPIFEDAEYVDSAEKLEKNIRYLKNIIPTIAGFILIAGFASAYLLMNRRRMEIAILRSIGEKGSRVFLMFFSEQFILAFAGSLLSIGAFTLFTGFSAGYVLSLGFFAGYVLGCVFSLLRMAGSNLLDVLCDKE